MTCLVQYICAWNIHVYLCVSHIFRHQHHSDKQDGVCHRGGKQEPYDMWHWVRVKKILMDNKLFPAYLFHALCHFRNLKMSPRRFEWLPLKGHLRLIIKDGGHLFTEDMPVQEHLEQNI